jgi:hypothetical protein
VGQTGQLTAIERLTSTTTQDVTATATWQSSNPSVATVSATGFVTAVAIGSSIVTASNQGVAGTLVVSVLANTVTSVLVVGPTSLPTGQSSELTAAVSTASGMQVVTSGVAWQSSNSGVAAVSSAGVLTAVAAGTTTISATYGGVTGTLAVTVIDVTVTSIAIFGAASVGTSSTAQLTASATLADGSARIVTNLAAWQSSDTSKATVSSSGLVTWVATGATTITATYLGVSGAVNITTN